MNKCINCGGPIVEQKFCPACGTQVATPDTTVPAASPEVPSDTSAPATARVRGSLAGRVQEVFTGPGREKFQSAAVEGVVAYAVVWALTLVLCGATLLSLAPGVSLDPAWAFTLPAQLVGLALGGTFTISGASMGIAATASLVWLPLAITAALVVSSALLARRAERLSPTRSRTDRWALAATSGIVVAIAANVVAAMIPFRATFGSTETLFDMMASGTLSGSATSTTLFFGAFAAASLSSYLARSRVARRSMPASDRVRSSFAAGTSDVAPAIAAWGAAMGGLLTLTLLVIVPVNAGPLILLSAPLWLPTATLDGLAFVNFAPVEISGPLASLLGGDATSAWMPTAIPAWATVVAVIVNVMAIVIAGAVLHLRRTANNATSSSRWLWSIGSFVALGVAVSMLGRLSITTKLDTSSLSDSVGGLLGLLDGGVAGLAGPGGSAIDGMGSTYGAFGPVPWTFVIFAALGALIELSARFVAPIVLAMLPERVLHRASGFIRQPAPAAAVAASATAATAKANSPSPEQAVHTDRRISTVATMTPEKLRRVKMIAGVSALSIAVVGLGAVTIGVVNRVVFSPTNQVESYLTSIVAGEVEAALAIADIDAPSRSRILLTDEFMESTTKGLSGFDIIDTEITEGDARVDVALDQDGSKSSATYRLTPKPNKWLLFDQWRFEPVVLPDLSIMLPSGVTRLEINGTSVTLTAEDINAGGVSYVAFPGTYDVALGSDEKWIQATPQRTELRIGEEFATEPIAFQIEASDALTDSVSAQISGWLADCATASDLEPEGCPFEAYSWSDATDVVWTIETEPSFELSRAPNSGEWTISTVTSGDASVTYMEPSFFGDPSAESDQDAFGVDGVVTFIDGEPVFEPADGGYYY